MTVIQSNPITIHGGATVNGVQVDTQVIMARRGFNQWPTLKDGLNDWEAKVRDIDCQDRTDVPIRSIKMNPHNGFIYRDGKDPNMAVPATKTALGHLISYVPKSSKADNAVNNLLDYPPFIRAQMLADLLQRPENRNVVLRTALANNAQRAIRAIVSDIHSQEFGDDLKVIEVLRTINDTTAKLRVVRQWDYTHVEIVMPSAAIELKKGDIAYGALSMYNSETKGGSFTTEASLHRLHCLNGMTAPGQGTEFRVRHIGDITPKMRTSIRVGLEGVMENLNNLKKSYTIELPWTRAEAIERFVTHHSLPETTGTGIAALWDVDGEMSAGHSLGGLINAVTRFAQSQPVEAAKELELVAGRQAQIGLAGL